MQHRIRLASAIGRAVLFGLFVSTPVFAGGDSFMAKVIAFHDLGGDEYRIVLRQLTPLSVSDTVPTSPIVIFLRHDEDAMRTGLRDAVSKEKYVAAIELLKRQIAQSRTIEFGVMGGSGLAPTDGKPGDFQSNSLTVEEGVVFAWNGAIR